MRISAFIFRLSRQMTPYWIACMLIPRTALDRLLTVLPPHPQSSEPLLPIGIQLASLGQLPLISQPVTQLHLDTIPIDSCRIHQGGGFLLMIERNAAVALPPLELPEQVEVMLPLVDEGVPADAQRLQPVGVRRVQRPIAHIAPLPFQPSPELRALLDVVLRDVGVALPPGVLLHQGVVLLPLFGDGVPAEAKAVEQLVPVGIELAFLLEAALICHPPAQLYDCGVIPSRVASTAITGVAFRQNDSIPGRNEAVAMLRLVLL
mmetsp:Transcript_10125/g.28409  ORF Transcript_10125/g.28409 Transcript_10125/m.28409 type:complete len:262 (+) Transcript_10125:450-1235(+)